ncbi:MAG: hypothetical protein ACFE8P_13680, partial [Promethearchaeota archaeon]
LRVDGKAALTGFCNAAGINIESLRELKNVARGSLLTEIPFLVMLNKQDLSEVIHAQDFKQVLIDEKLWYEPQDKLAVWNPIIYETCALWGLQKDIFRSFNECTRRTGLYQIYGNGKAPVNNGFLKESLNNK